MLATQRPSHSPGPPLPSILLFALCAAPRPSLSPPLLSIPFLRCVLPSPPGPLSYPSFAVCVRKWHGGEERVLWRREERGGCLRRGGESPHTIGLWAAINALVTRAAAWLFCCSLLIGGLRDKSVCVHNNSVVVVCLVVTSWGEMIYAYNEGIILFFTWGG